MRDYIPKGEFVDSPKIRKKKQNNVRGVNALSASPRYHSPHFVEESEGRGSRGVSMGRRQTTELTLVHKSEINATRDTFKRLMAS